MASLNTSCVTFSNGITPVAGTGQTYSFAFTGTWELGDTYTVTLTDSLSGTQTQIGAGYVTGVQPVFAFVYNNVGYILAGTNVYTSAEGVITTWNDPTATGNGFISLSDPNGASEAIVSMASYQGKLVFFSRYNAQIWNIDALLANWSLSQVLRNIGTVGPNSVVSLGDLDVFFLSDTGIRSLRVRDNTLNAFVNDLGSPIDSLIVAALLANNGVASCGCVEPSSGRYWCYLNGLIYVFSYYPSNKIQAWSTYQPQYQVVNGINVLGAGALYSVGIYIITGTSNGKPLYTNSDNYIISWVTSPFGAWVVFDTSFNPYYASTSNVATPDLATGWYSTNNGGLTPNPANNPVPTFTLYNNFIPFTPQKFVLFLGQVVVRDPNTILTYGGINNDTFDGSVASAATSWLDLKEPDTIKKAVAVDSAFTGIWQFSGGMDQLSEALTVLCTLSSPTFQIGKVSFPGDGYHFKLQAQTTGTTEAVLSSLIFRYTGGGEK